MIIQNNQIDLKQLNLIQSLASRCKKIDEGTPSFYYHLITQSRWISTNLLYFKQKHLVGFLTTFFFHEGCCEIALMVDPEERKKGIARQLLSRIYPLLASQNVTKVILSCPSVYDDWHADLGGKIDHQEFNLHLVSHHSAAPVCAPTNILNFSLATPEDIPNLVALDLACFTENAKNLDERFAYLLQDPQYSILVGKKDQEVVGKTQIRWENTYAVLSDIAVFPAHQNKGFASEMLAYSINHVLAAGKTKITLDVEPKNKHALRLYTNFGFKINEAKTFWIYSLEEVKRFTSSSS